MNAYYIKGIGSEWQLIELRSNNTTRVVEQYATFDEAQERYYELWSPRPVQPVAEQLSLDIN